VVDIVLDAIMVEVLELVLDVSEILSMLSDDYVSMLGGGSEAVSCDGSGRGTQAM